MSASACAESDLSEQEESGCSSGTALPALGSNVFKAVKVNKSVERVRVIGKGL